MPFARVAAPKVPPASSGGAVAKRPYTPMPIIGLEAASNRLRKKLETEPEMPSACKRLDALGQFSEHLGTWIPSPWYNPGLEARLIPRSHSIPTIPSAAPEQMTESVLCSKSLSMVFSSTEGNVRTKSQSLSLAKFWESGLEIPDFDQSEGGDGSTFNAIPETPRETVVREALAAPGYEGTAALDDSPPIVQTQADKSPVASRRVMKADTPENLSRKSKVKVPPKIRRSLFSVFSRQQKHDDSPPIVQTQADKSPVVSRRVMKADTPENPSRKSKAKVPPKTRRSLFSVFTRQQTPKPKPKPKQSIVANLPGGLVIHAYTFAADLLNAADCKAVDVRRMEERQNKWSIVAADTPTFTRNTISLTLEDLTCTCSKMPKPFFKKWALRQRSDSTKCNHCLERAQLIPEPMLASEDEKEEEEEEEEEEEKDANAVTFAMIAECLKVSDAVAGRMYKVYTQYIVQGLPTESISGTGIILQVVDGEVVPKRNPNEQRETDLRIDKVSKLLGTSSDLSRRMLRSIPYDVRIDGLGPHGYFEDMMLCSVTET